VEAACAITPQLPARLADLMTRPERYDVAPARLQEIEAHIAARAISRPSGAK
jgi:threonine synthase